MRGLVMGRILKLQPNYRPVGKYDRNMKVVTKLTSLEKRIQKVEELSIVIDKWRKLNDAKKNLTGFKLGADELSSTVIIRDVAG